MPQHPFTRLAIVNRGEPAMRLIHAVRELNAQRDEPIVLIALYTEVERHAMFVREADEAVLPGPPDGRRSGYLDHGALERALVAARADAAWVGWGFVAEDPGLRRPVRAARDRLRRPRPGGHAARRRQDRRQAARRGGGRPGRAVERRPGGHGRGRAPARDADRLPAHGQGHGGRRRARDPARRRAGRPGGRVPVRPRRGRAGLRRRHAPAGAPGRSGAAHRGAGDRRRPGRRMGGRRARLQLPAPPPEGDRGVGQPGADGRAERRAAGGGAAAGAARRLPQRRHRRVPLRARDAPFLVHGGQRPPAGRAPRHRGGDRARPREAAAARRRRRPPGGRAAGRPRARRRGAAERRGPGARLPARSRPGRAAAAADRARACASTPAWPRATRSPPSSTR